MRPVRQAPHASDTLFSISLMENRSNNTIIMGVVVEVRNVMLNGTVHLEDSI